MQSNEVDLPQAMDMLDVPEEILGRLAAAGQLKSPRADGTIYFFARGNRNSCRSPDRRSHFSRSRSCERRQLDASRERNEGAK
jgi:hypothetical protein